jgi:predicted YcjX-like family ATPase
MTTNPTHSDHNDKLTTVPTMPAGSPAAQLYPAGDHQQAQQLQPVQQASHQRPAGYCESVVAAMYADQTEKKRRETSLIISGLEPSPTSDQDLFSDLCQSKFHICSQIL